MGTRGVWGFRLDEKDKVTYNHWDSYPEGLGNTVMTFVKRTNPAALHAIAKRIILVDEHGKPGPSHIKIYRQFFDSQVGSQKLEDWYCLLRGIQGRPEMYWDLKVRHMIDNHLFLGESLFCEWAYIINLDSGLLEVYEGCNAQDHHSSIKGSRREVKKTGRYWDMGRQESAGGDRTYYGVALIDEIGLEYIRGWDEKEIAEKCSTLQKEDEE